MTSPSKTNKNNTLRRRIVITQSGVHILLLYYTHMAVTLQRELQIPVENIEFSKNRIYVEVSDDTVSGAEAMLEKAFAKQMADFNTSLEQMKSTTEFVQALEAKEFLGYLKTSVIAQVVLQEYKRYKSTKVK